MLLKVGDFATVVMAPSGDSTTMAVASVVIGTPAYLAPEAYSFDISTKLDSYSFGVVLLEVITGWFLEFVCLFVKPWVVGKTLGFSIKPWGLVSAGREPVWSSGKVLGW